MAKKRATKTVRLDATITNPQPVSTRPDERILPATKPAPADIPVLDLLNTLRETEGRDSGAMLALQERYDREIDRSLRRHQIRDWNDRQIVTSDVWQTVVRIARIPSDDPSAWNPGRAATARDPFRPLLDRIVLSRAMDFLDERQKRRKRFEAFAEDVDRFGDDVASLAEPTGAARRRLLEGLNPPKPRKAIDPQLSRRFAAAARPHLPAAVAGLSEPLKRVLLERASGRKSGDIAAAEGISQGEASKRFTKARQQVIDRLNAAPKAG